MSAWMTSGRSRLKAKQKRTFSQTGFAVPNVTSTRKRKPISSLNLNHPGFPKRQYGMAAKYAYSNPIYRRGIIASIPSHPEHESNRQVEYSNNRSNRYFPNAPSHRRIRDPTSFKHRWASQKSYVAEQPMKSRSLAPLNQPRPPFAGRKKPSYVYENFYSDELADSHGFPEYQHYETLGVEQYQTSEHLLPPPYQGQPYRGIPRRQENHVLPRMNNQDYFHESYENFPPHAAGENYDIPPFQRRVERKTGLDLNKIKKPRDIDPLPSNFERHAPAPRLPHRAGLDISKIKSSWDTKPDPPFLSNRASLPKQINENSDYTTTQHGFGVSQGQRMYQRDTQYVSHSASTKHQFLPESSDFDIDAYYHDNDFAAESYISNGNQVNRSSDNLKSNSNVPEYSDFNDFEDLPFDSNENASFEIQQHYQEDHDDQRTVQRGGIPFYRRLAKARRTAENDNSFIDSFVLENDNPPNMSHTMQQTRRVPNPPDPLQQDSAVDRIRLFNNDIEVDINGVPIDQEHM